MVEWFYLSSFLVIMHIQFLMLLNHIWWVTKNLHGKYFSLTCSSRRPMEADHLNEAEGQLKVPFDIKS